MMLPKSSVRRFSSLVTAFVGAAIVLLWGSAVFASEDPLKLSFLNAAAKGGDSAHGTINEFLKKSDDIDTTSQDDVWEYARKELGLEEKDFRSSSLREDNVKNFQALMKDLDIEALLILDVFSRGRKLQVVAIGPSGTEIADVRREVSRGRISKSEAKGVLKETFAELVPAVRDFREAGGWDAIDTEEEEDPGTADLIPEEDEEEGDEGDPEEGEGEEELSLKEKAIKKRKGKYPALQPGANLRLGILAGKRDLSMTAESNFELTHSSPFVGFGGRVDFIFTQFGEDSALGATVLGGYAPFTTIFAENQNFPSQYARLGAEVRYLKAFSPEFLINVFGGGEAMSITIDQNPFYTGHRYIMARAGAGILYAVGPVNLEVAGAVLPVFGVNNSAGAFGEVDGLSLGFEPMAGLSFGLSDEISVMLRYSGQIFSVSYPEPVVLNEEAASSDIVHTGLIAVGYRL
jgi:hypothetical protein